MKIFFEDREARSKPSAVRNVSYIYPAHFHLDMEIFLQRNKGYGVSIGGKTYAPSDNAIVVVDSYDVHSYDTVIDGYQADDSVVIIPYKYLGEFNRRRQGMKIAEPVICDEALCKRLLAIVDEFLLPQNVDEGVREAAIRLFLALLAEKLTFSEGKIGEEAVLIRKILSYIQENYRDEISLESTANHFGYTAAHVSRAFHRYIKTSLPEYVNRLRLEYIDRCIATGDKRKKIDLIFEAGFKSQQTYYRARAKRQE